MMKERRLIANTAIVLAAVTACAFVALYSLGRDHASMLGSSDSRLENLEAGVRMGVARCLRATGLEANAQRIEWRVGVDLDPREKVFLFVNDLSEEQRDLARRRLLDSFRKYRVISFGLDPTSDDYWVVFVNDYDEERVRRIIREYCPGAIMQD